MNTSQQAPNEREEIEMLLPWYATGKLEPGERARVAAYLDQHPDMAAQLEMIRDEMHETTAANEALHLPSARGIDDLMAKVRADEPAGSTSRGAVSGYFSSLLSGLSDFFNVPSANAVRWAAAAAAVVVLAQAVTIGTLVTNRDQGGSYQTASGETREARPEGTFALVRFSNGATATDITAALIELKMSISDGPKAGGLFVVRIGDKSMSETERNKALTEMRGMPRIFTLVTLTR